MPNTKAEIYIPAFQIFLFYPKEAYLPLLDMDLGAPCFFKKATAFFAFS